MIKNYNLWDINHSNKLYKPKGSSFFKSKHLNYKKKNWSKQIILTTISVFFWLLLILSIVLARIFIYKDLPDVSQVKNMVFSQSTIIQDRNWVELYKVFAENRQYIDFKEVSSNMINAIIAIEDQRYWEHSGLDPMWLLRAAIKKVLNPSSRMQWASTIPQQFVRNILLTKDRKVQRKLKEIVLTKRLNGVIQKWVSKEQWSLNKDTLKREMKKRY
jgi:penicillin-binding protein 1A